MKTIRQAPLPLILRAASLWLRGRAHLTFRVEDELLTRRGERFVAFRRLEVDAGTRGPAGPGARLRVQFRFKSLPALVNRLLALLPVPLIAAQPGFRSKTWFQGELSGDFVGLYEFDSVTAAEAYWSSVPMRMMRRRAAAGSLRHVVIPAG